MAAAAAAAAAAAMFILKCTAYLYILLNLEE
jgi:hypothetical protein